MRIVSPAHFPQISTSNSSQHKPHQSIFFESQQVLMQEDAEYGKHISNMPELSSMQFKKKIFNNRI
jgi:hypothetical protein